MARHCFERTRVLSESGPRGNGHVLAQVPDLASAATLQRALGTLGTDGNGYDGLHGLLGQKAGDTIKELGRRMATDEEVNSRMLQAFAGGARPPCEKLVASAREVLALAPDGKIQVYAEGVDLSVETLQKVADWKLDSVVLSEAFAVVSDIGDDVLRAQLSFLASYRKLCMAAAMLSKQVQENPDCIKSVSKALVPAIEDVQSELRMFGDFLKRTGGDETIFKEGGSKLEFLYGLFDATAGARLVDEASALLQTCRAAWARDVMSMTQVIDDGCPTGWSLKRDELYSDAEWHVKLLKNPAYSKVGSTTDALHHALTALKGFKEPLVDVNIVSDGREAVDNGVDMVTTTFMLFKVVVELPRIRNKKVRAAKIRDLRQAVAAKRVRFGNDLAARLKVLEDEEFD